MITLVIVTCLYMIIDDGVKKYIAFFAGVVMKIVADENIPFVAECFSSIGEVVTISGREITSKVIANTDVLLVRSVTPVNEDLLAGSRVAKKCVVLKL